MKWLTIGPLPALGDVSVWWRVAVSVARESVPDITLAAVPGMHNLRKKTKNKKPFSLLIFDIVKKRLDTLSGL